VDGSADDTSLKLLEVKSKSFIADFETKVIIKYDVKQ
jgi:hypothetical protein